MPQKPGITILKMPKINAGLQVACPCCHAEAGQPCVSPDRGNRPGRLLSLSFAHHERNALGKLMESDRRIAARAARPLADGRDDD